MKKFVTESICPICKKNITAKKFEKDGSVFIEKSCDEHGTFLNKIAKDSNRFFDKTFSVEGKPYTPITEYKGKCGQDCGWCNEHKQHICTGLVEITNSCNLNCPICYFGKKKNEHISIEEFKKRVETLLKIENGHLDILQISGGECTIHPQFLEILDKALKFDIRRVVINTNGLAFLNNEKIFNKIKSLNEKIDVYLQFDGFNDEIYTLLRGRSLLKEKLEIINKLNDAEVKMNLAVTVCKGNLEEIPKILDFVTKVKHISGITFQRLTKVGSAVGTKIESVFQEDIILSMTKSGLLKYEDMIPLPCSHENCTSLGFLLCTKDKIYSMGDYIDYKNCKPALQDKLVFDKTVLDYLKNNVCSCFIGKIFGNAKILDSLKDFIKSEKTTSGDMKIVRLLVKNFMDTDTFDWERAKKCCTAVSIGNNRVIPFCVYNNLKGEI